MMYIKEIFDITNWESFISRHSPQSLFQSFNWGEILEKIQNSSVSASRESRIQNLWRFGIYDDIRLVGIAQVNKVIARKGNFLHIRHGPILSEWKKEYLSFFLHKIKDLADKEKAKFIRISPLIQNTLENRIFIKSLGFINAPIYGMDGEYYWVLELKKTQEELLAGMRKTTRYLIRQAQKLGIEIVKSKDIADIDEFLNLYKQTARRHNFIEHKGIKEEFEILLKDNQILLFKGYYGKRLLSAAIIIFYNHQAIYHHSASIEQKIPVNYLLQWEVIKEAKKRNMNLYNFWGIAPEDKTKHPWQGLTSFKKGFGGEKREYLHTQDLPLSILYCTTYILESFRKIRKGY